MYIFIVRKINKDNIKFYRLRRNSNNNQFVMSLKTNNMLEDLIAKYNNDQFKRNLHEWLLENPLYSMNEFLEHK